MIENTLFRLRKTKKKHTIFYRKHAGTRNVIFKYILSVSFEIVTIDGIIYLVQVPYKWQHKNVNVKYSKTFEYAILEGIVNTVHAPYCTKPYFFSILLIPNIFS